MRRLMVDVHERAADVGQDLDLVLQLLADVVRLPERCVGVHDDVDLDVVVLVHSSVRPPLDTYQVLTGPLCMTAVSKRIGREKEDRNSSTHVVGPHRVNLLDLARERRRLVDEQLQKLVWGRLAREQLELLVYRSAPRNNNACTNLISY